MAEGFKAFNGVYRAVVTKNNDPKNLNRLKVKIPQLTGYEEKEVETDWVWPIVSTKRPPAIGTGTWITFIGGDPDYPVWLGEFSKEPQGLFSYGSWYSTVDQTAGATGTEYVMSVNNTDYSEGISVKNGSKFTVEHDATYNLQFSAQLQHRTGTGGGSGDNVWIWLKKNGSNVADSATKLAIPTGKYQVASWNFFIKLKKNEYVELAWSVDTVDIALEANSTASPAPAVPSLIVTMNQIA